MALNKIPAGAYQKHEVTPNLQMNQIGHLCPTGCSHDGHQCPQGTVDLEQPLVLVVKATKQSGCGVILEGLHAAEKWMPGMLAGAIHIVVELAVTLVPRNPRCQTGVMGRTGWPHVGTVKSLMDQSVSAPGIARTTWSPWWTSTWTPRLGRGN